MCGISGIISLNKKAIYNGRNITQNMAEKMDHRGPDAQNFWNSQDSLIHLAHNRLSIIDLSDSANQPMVDELCNVIVLNGEIYNYKALKKRYFSNEKFKTSSDTEVLLKMYQKFGTNMFQHLNGMFAFAIWDNKRRELVLARDRSGEKPLYYNKSNGTFSFASEIKAILQVPWIDAKLDETALYHFLTFGQLPPPLTMFKGIDKFEAGHYMVVGLNGITDYKPYWNLNYEKLQFNDEMDLSNMVYNALDNAVSSCMVSDVPVGAYISGGVDSSAVLALMRQKTANQINTYSIGFKDADQYNELDYAQLMSKKYNTSHYEKMISKNDLIDFLPTVVDIFDEPLADTTSIPIYFLSKMAKKNGSKVILTGDGADELFAGYRNFMKYDKNYPLYNQLLKMPLALRKTLLFSVGLYDKKAPIYEILSRATKNQELAWIGANGFKESTKKNIMSDSFQNSTKNTSSYEVVEKYLRGYNKLTGGQSTRDHIDWMCYMGYKFSDPDRYLFRGDRLGMANSIEARQPFMDYRLVELAMSIPSKYKIKANESKYILKKSLERLLPHDILYRKKMGFNVPINEWAGDILIDHIEQNVHSFSSNTGLFDESGILRITEGLKKGNRNYTNSAWMIYFLMKWFDKWL